MRILYMVFILLCCNSYCYGQDFSLSRLHDTIAAAGIPIDGISGEEGNIRIDFKESATAQQRTDAQAIVAAFDWSAQAQIDYENAREADLIAIQNQAATAIANIDTYLATADTATNTQVREEVKKIDQRQKAVIKALLRVINKVYK